MNHQLDTNVFLHMQEEKEEWEREREREGRGGGGERCGFGQTVLRSVLGARQVAMR